MVAIGPIFSPTIERFDKFQFYTKALETDCNGLQIFSRGSPWRRQVVLRTPPFETTRWKTSVVLKSPTRIVEHRKRVNESTYQRR